MKVDGAPHVGLSATPISAAALAAGVSSGCGAVVSFEGRVRSRNEGRPVARLHYDAYPEMAESVMGDIVSAVSGEFDVAEVRVQHRTGTLDVGETAVVVVVGAEHRAAAFDAARELMERVKREVPIWKKEVYADGSETWLGEAP